MLNCSHFISTSSFTIHVEPRIKFWRVFCHSYSSFLQPPNSRDLHLWCLLSDEVRQLNLLSSYENILPYEERSAMHQKSNKKVQEEYLLTRTLARTLIARYTGGHVNSSDLKFERGRFGKPKIVWPTESLDGQQWTPPQLDFNLSHTESLIICAITGASQVGVDVEMKNRVPQTDFVKFARRKFSTVEAVHMEQLQDMEAKRHFFLRLWNLKEAYGKAIGNGVRQKTLHEAGFTFENFSPAKQYLDSLTGIPFHEQVCAIKPAFSDAKHWQFILFLLADSHNVSVCLERGGDVEPLRLQIRKTIPLVKDEILNNVVVTGLSI